MDNQATAPITYFLTVAVATTIRLEAFSSLATGVTVDDANGRTIIAFSKI